ncbi:MAG TPA: hypothetical protein VN457_08350 [Chlamydiales bacterium]|nr:hypothetical protein [Chlamydiales bacterium]
MVRIESSQIPEFSSSNASDVTDKKFFSQDMVKHLPKKIEEAQLSLIVKGELRQNVLLINAVQKGA